MGPGLPRGADYFRGTFEKPARIPIKLPLNIADARIASLGASKLMAYLLRFERAEVYLWRLPLEQQRRWKRSRSG